MQKKKTPASNIFPMIVVVLMIGWFFVPLLPRVVKAVVPFPKLEDATYIEGTFDYEGEWPQVRVPRYFVVNTQGRHEFRCGYLGGRHTCFSKPSAFKDQPIKVWNTFLYGSLQYEVTTIPGVRPHPFDLSGHAYADARAAYFNPLYAGAQGVNYFGMFLMLCFLCWLIMKEVWRRQELREQITPNKQSASKES